MIRYMSFETWEMSAKTKQEDSNEGRSVDARSCTLSFSPKFVLDGVQIRQTACYLQRGVYQ